MLIVLSSFLLLIVFPNLFLITLTRPSFCTMIEVCRPLSGPEHPPLGSVLLMWRDNVVSHGRDSVVSC